MRVIPGSHLDYKKINGSLAKSFGRSAEINNLPQAGELWEELLPEDLNPPHKIVGKSGTVTLMNSSLLHGATENLSDTRVRDVVILNYSKRVHVEFHKKYFLSRGHECIEFYEKTDKDPLFARTFGPQYKFFRINQTHLQILRTIRALGRCQIKNFKDLVRPVRRLLRNKKEHQIDLSSKRYLNIGCGANWTGVNTISLDFDPATCDVGLDLNTAERLPFPSFRFQGIYSSHCFEHLQEARVVFWLSECYRVLEPGGVLRLSMPDIESYFDAYEKRDAAFFDWIRGSAHYMEDSWLRLIVRAFAEPTVDSFTDDELYEMYSSMPLGQFLEFFKNRQEAITDQRLLLPHVHKSWWSASKISGLLSELGFVDVRPTSPMGSSCKEFTDDRFRYKHPGMSFFVEAIKPV
jgi:predicted SAM-dependent methyltransferase